MATYKDACKGDHDHALRLYAWNVAVTSAFWGGFNILEVALRNALNEQLEPLRQIRLVEHNSTAT